MLIFGVTVGGNSMWNKIKNVLTNIAQPETGKVAPITEGKKRTQVKTPKVASTDPAAVKPKKPRASKKKVVEDPDKKLATKNGEPWVKILSMDLDPDDPGNGAFELDWNDKFVANLIRAGYQGRTDADIVDNWFKAICRNVITESYEQDQADPSKRNERRRDLGNGRTEVS
jgi:hypothetical protein